MIDTIRERQRREANATFNALAIPPITETHSPARMLAMDRLRAEQSASTTASILLEAMRSAAGDIGDEDGPSPESEMLCELVIERIRAGL